MTIECPDCNGCGYDIIVVPVCCGCPTENNDCCGSPAPEQQQEACQRCGGSGSLER